jgi:hypothetical protein
MQCLSFNMFPYTNLELNFFDVGFPVYVNLDEKCDVVWILCITKYIGIYNFVIDITCSGLLKASQWT